MRLPRFPRNAHAPPFESASLFPTSAQRSVELHQRQSFEHGCYHLSSGQDSLTYAQIVRALRLHGKPMLHRFVPDLNWPALLVAMVVCVKVNWLSLLWKRKPAQVKTS